MTDDEYTRDYMRRMLERMDQVMDQAERAARENQPPKGHVGRNTEPSHGRVPERDRDPNLLHGFTRDPKDPDKVIHVVLDKNDDTGTPIREESETFFWSEPKPGRSVEETLAKEKEERLRDELTRDKEATVPIRYDSQERREAIQRHLESLGISRAEREVRDLYERGLGTPPERATERTIAEQQAIDRARLAQERDARRRDEQGRERE